MRIVCPGCAAEYDVPVSRMTPQRKLRCARCGDTWLAPEPPAPAPTDDTDPLEFRADPEPGDEAQPIAPLPVLTAMDRLSATAPPVRAPTGLIAAWVMTFVALFTLVGLVIVWREPLVRAWPASSRILGRAEPAAQGPPHATARAAEAAPPTKE